ncbi:MAG TPA: SET domain-containing protein-lysine N-methyltransferase [Gemmataceae bacterium]|nr:SET domain-containing protein-lysine N-methyltransferase [Gemmataceae bacterium]
MIELEIRAAGTKGKGVYAKSPIRAGERVIAMTGRLLTNAELTDDLLAMQVGPDLWLCSDGSSIDDMLNHSCAPNTGFLEGDTVLYALRDIAMGEEVTWDYSTSIAEEGWRLDCQCGAANCRGLIRPWGELSPADRERLRSTTLAFIRAT